MLIRHGTRSKERKVILTKSSRRTLSSKAKPTVVHFGTEDLEEKIEPNLERWVWGKGEEGEPTKLGKIISNGMNTLCLVLSVYYVGIIFKRSPSKEFIINKKCNDKSVRESILSREYEVYIIHVQFRVIQILFHQDAMMYRYEAGLQEFFKSKMEM